MAEESSSTEISFLYFLVTYPYICTREFAKVQVCESAEYLSVVSLFLTPPKYCLSANTKRPALSRILAQTSPLSLKIALSYFL